MDATAEMLDTLRREVARLPARERTIVLLSYVGGYSLIAIGQLLGLSRARVFQLKERAVHELRNRLS